MLARHGGLIKHQHQIEGINSRLDGLQAAILSAKLPHLPDWTKARQDAAKVYDAGLNQIEDVVVPEVAAGRTHVYHLYTIKHPRRDALAAHLSANGVQTRDQLSDRAAVPLQPIAASAIVPTSFPNAHRDQGKHLVAADVRRDHRGSTAHRDRSHSFVLSGVSASTITPAGLPLHARPFAAHSAGLHPG